MITSTDSADSTRRPNKARFVWQRRLLTTLAVVCTAPALLIVSGTLLPGIPLVGAFGTLCESFFSLHIVLLALAGLGFSLGAQPLGGQGTVKVTAVLSAVAALGAMVPIYSLIQTARRYDASISWLEHLHVTESSVPRRFPRQRNDTPRLRTRRCTSISIFRIGEPIRRHHLRCSCYMAGASPSAIQSQARNWDRWLAQRGYAVFDVDYRLAPPVSWNS